MAQMKALLQQTFNAAADLSSFRYRFVVMSADYTVNIAGAGARALGVLQDNPAAAGRGALVCTDGTTKLVAGAAVAAGALLTSDATGRGVTAGGGTQYSAKALQAATAAGDLIEVQLENGTA